MFFLLTLYNHISLSILNLSSPLLVMDKVKKKLLLKEVVKINLIGFLLYRWFQFTYIDLYEANRPKWIYFAKLFIKIHMFPFPNILHFFSFFNNTYFGCGQGVGPPPRLRTCPQLLGSFLTPSLRLYRGGGFSVITHILTLV